ncbi:hypothetical protein [Muribaculum caecicola]|uniref:Uncharacterized protein n=1 Tax=Muribaculum caecicola TaxID=3038144 RepID=A0AC61S7B3_9BACT|nr:hypothetical protein [Muribaculum caecicola]THG54635.1 hypothetical protein E5990_02275 [Muribaculum caecicola]
MLLIFACSISWLFIWHSSASFLRSESAVSRSRRSNGVPTSTESPARRYTSIIFVVIGEFIISSIAGTTIPVAGIVVANVVDNVIAVLFMLGRIDIITAAIDTTVMPDIIIIFLCALTWRYGFLVVIFVGPC